MTTPGTLEVTIVVLATLDAVADVLACPRCRARLVAERHSFACSASSCRFAAPGSFPRVGRWAILIDPARSVIDEAELARLTQEATTAPHPPLAERLPSPLRRIVKPRNNVATEQVSRLLAMLPRPSRVLVVGGGSVGNGVEALYATGPEVEVIGLDLFGSDVDLLVADAHAIPLRDGAVDAVVVQAVLEHVLEPSRVVSEIHRVLTADGLVYAETPFLQHVHAGAHDFTRYTLSGHRWLFSRFAEIRSGVVAGPGTELLWSLDHLVRALSRSRAAGRLVRVALGWLRVLDRFADERYASDAASAVFFLGRRSEQALTPAEVVRYYRGAQ